VSRFELPFDTDAYASGRVGLLGADYPTRDDRQRFWEELQLRAAAVPGVAAVALSGGLPGIGSGDTRIRLEGQTYAEPTDRPITHQELVSPGYFELLDAEPLEGATFGPQHTRDVELVAVVNRSFATRFWPDGGAVGRRFRTGVADTIPWMTVIGVVEDLQMQGFQPAGNPGARPTDTTSRSPRATRRT
jgi:putative ABC transport system permease protein